MSALELDLSAGVEAAARQACIEGAARQAPEGARLKARVQAARAWDTGAVPAMEKHVLREMVTPLVHAASRPLAAQGWVARDNEWDIGAPNPYTD